MRQNIKVQQGAEAKPHPGPNGAAAHAGAPRPPTPRASRSAKVQVPGPYELTEFGDPSPKTVDWITRAALEETERRLGYPLTLVQGSYNKGGVPASAGTHDGGGAVDLLPWDWQRKVRALRSVGFAAWHRPRVPGLWGEHIHAVLIGNEKLADIAQRQVVAYRAGRDGLKSNDPDPFWRPDPIPVFAYPPAEEPAEQRPVGDPAVGAAEAVPPLGSAFPPLRTMDGVDTSHFQAGRLDVKAAQAAGVRFWYAKATEGTTFIDKTYGKRIRQARQAGMPVGSYHFARPDGGDAAAEARFFLAHTDIQAGDMLPMLDLEAMGDLSPGELTTWTGTWVTTVKRSLAGRGLDARPIIYTRFNLGSGFGCFLWVARYSDDFRPPTIPKPWVRAAIWQHSDGKFGPVKQVPGFGAVDANALHPDVPLAALRIRALAAPADSPASGSVPTPIPVGPVAPPAGAVAPPPSSGVDAVRQQLQIVARNIQAALDALPKE